MDHFKSFLTMDEWHALMAEFAGQEIGWRHVSSTQLSIARHSGALVISGKRFTYLPATDELIRDDVLKLVAKWRKSAEPRVPAQLQQQIAGL